MNGDIKIGKLLCDEDIITKRQLNKALHENEDLFLGVNAAVYETLDEYEEITKDLRRDIKDLERRKKDK